MIELAWVVVPGGVCAYGDRAVPRRIPPLAWTVTPVTCGHLSLPPYWRADLPVVGLDHAEAEAIAAQIGGRLPRSVEWEWMAAGAQQRRYPWGDEEWTADRANLRDSGFDRPTPVDAHTAGATPDGLLDVGGNVWEWTASQMIGHGAIIRGGSHHSIPLYATCRFLNAAPVELRSPGIGLRVVRPA